MTTLVSCPPGSVKERVKRAVRKVFRLQENPPIVIYGPGGMGKSALIARFIWEHATIPDARFPFVYLDFDRVSLRADEPLTLLAEAVRQLGLQYAETRVFADRVRSGWQSELISRSAESVTSISSQGGTTAQLQPRGQPKVTGSATSEISPACWRTSARVRSHACSCSIRSSRLNDAAASSSRACAGFSRSSRAPAPRLRIVIAGRIPLSVDGFPTSPRPLGDFDEAAAQLFLEKRGVQSPELIRTIINRIGRSPLSLLLAATAVQQAQKSGEPENLKLTGTRGAHLTEGQIQGYLYRRILLHIQDDEVRRAAYPGLVLRRVTPDIIQKVLAEPCKVEVPDETAAQNLFDR